MFMTCFNLELVSLRDKNECQPHPPASIAVPFRGLFKIFDDHPLLFMGVSPGWNVPLVYVYLSLSSPPFKWIFINIPFKHFRII